MPRLVVVDHSNNDTAAVASIEDLAECTARADARIETVLQTVMAQRRSTAVALDYVTVLGSGVKANCWSLAEAAGHDGQGRMQDLLRSYRWNWVLLRDQLAGLAAASIPDPPGDLIGPGIAIDETAQLKKGEATACVAPQHAGCTGGVENCVTTVFSAYVTANGQAWVDFDVYMPQRWASDAARRRAAGIPEDLEFATKPQLAMNQLDRQLAAGSPARWVAFDEVYGRSEPLRTKAAEHGLAYVGIIPCDYQIRLPSGATIRADQAVAGAVFERRSCGNGSKGPRYSDWALTTTAIPGQYLLIRRLLSRPDSYTFYLCWAPPDRPATSWVGHGRGVRVAPGSVSRARPPNRTCDSHRTRLSTCLARCSAAGGGGGPGGRDVRAAVAVAGHFDAGGAGEHDPVVGDPPALVAEATSELFAAGQAVFTADPAGQSQPGVAVDAVECCLGHPVPKVVCPSS